MSDAAFDVLFPADKPTIFAFHGYPWLIHRLTYRRHNHDNVHVRGYKEEGTTTTPFDMTVLNDLDRFHLALDVVERVARLAAHVDPFRAWVQQRLAEHERYIRQRGEDLPEIRDWRWSIAGSLTP
jgi:xylulose-5-phosphate/fructose-6-phosphate phosphoketolase